MKKSALLLLTLALYAGSASAAIHTSEGRPDANEIPLTASTPWGQSIPIQSYFANLPGPYATIPGLENIGRHTRSTAISGINQTYTHTMGIYNSNTGALIRQSPALSLTALATDYIDFTWGFFTVGSGTAAKHYSVETMYALDPNTGVMGSLKVQVVQHPATGAAIKKFVLTFPASNAYGTIDHSQCFVKDLNMDGVEEIVIKYSKRGTGTQRIRTFLIHNVETGALVRRMTITTPS